MGLCARRFTKPFLFIPKYRIRERKEPFLLSMHSVLIMLFTLLFDHDEVGRFCPSVMVKFVFIGTGLCTWHAVEIRNRRKTVFLLY